MAPTAGDFVAAIRNAYAGNEVAPRPVMNYILFHLIVFNDSKSKTIVFISRIVEATMCDV
jgi:hypothetical protein